MAAAAQHPSRGVDYYYIKNIRRRLQFAVCLEGEEEALANQKSRKIDGFWGNKIC